MPNFTKLNNDMIRALFDFSQPHYRHLQLLQQIMN